MKTLDWLDNQYHMGSERVVVSNEGIIGAMHDFIASKMGTKSQKGTDYKTIKLEHTYNFKATVTALTRYFGNPAWLNKQVFWRNAFESDNIINYTGVLKPDEVPVMLNEVNGFVVGVFKDWHRAYATYFKQMAPIAEIIKTGYTDENRVKLLRLVNALKPIEAFYVKPPRSFPVQGRPYPDTFDQITEPEPIKGLLESFTNPSQIRHVVDVLVPVLNQLEDMRTDFYRSAFRTVGTIQSPTLYRLGHMKTPPLPKGCTEGLEEWVQIAKAIDPMIQYWESHAFTITRRYYGDIILAVSRWIERSIR